MRTNTKKGIVLAILFAILILSIFFFANGVNTRVYGSGDHDPDLSVGEEELTPVGGDVLPSLSIDKVDSPFKGRTDWTNASRPLGFAIYLNGVSFAVNQVHLQAKMTTDSVAKITFTRGEKTATPLLICATKDGLYESKSCFVFFFGGALLGETTNEYKNGDKAVIEEGCILTCAEGSYLVSEKIEYVYDGVQWVDMASSYESLTYITYISEPQEEGNNIIFNLKTTTIFGAYDIVTEELKQSILVNDVTVKDLISNGKASIGYTISRIVLSVDKSALKLNDYDTISIKKGALLKGDETDGLRLKDDQTFRYSYTLKRADYIPDHEYYGKLSSMAIIDFVEIANDVLNASINGTKYDLAHSIWIHFKWSAKDNYDSFQMHLSADQSRVSDEKLCYEYQKLGFFYSVTDLLKVNGKSIYEWMILDAKNGTGDSFYIEYLPYEIDSGRVLRIVVADESLMDIGLNVTQSIEFKNGFINPNLGEIQDDSFYSIKAEDAQMNAKFNMESKQEKGNADKGSGCNAEIRVEDSAVVFLVGALIVTSIVLFRKLRERG